MGFIVFLMLLFILIAKHINHHRGMIHEEDLTQEQNEFIDALEDADERMQKVFREMAKEGIDDPRILMPFD